MLKFLRSLFICKHQWDLVCASCGLVIARKGSPVPKHIVSHWTFNWVEGQPVVCELCMAGKMGVRNAEWRKDLVSFLGP